MASLFIRLSSFIAVISLSVIDDAIPEPDETIQIQLHNPTGGAVLNDLSGRGKVIILANDVVGGVIGFASVSKSLIAQEGVLLVNNCDVESVLMLCEFVLSHMYPTLYASRLFTTPSRF